MPLLPGSESSYGRRHIHRASDNSWKGRLLQMFKGSSDLRRAGKVSNETRSTRLGVQALAGTRAHQESAAQPRPSPSLSVASPHLVPRHQHVPVPSLSLSCPLRSQRTPPADMHPSARVPPHARIPRHDVGVDAQDRQLGELARSEQRPQQRRSRRTPPRSKRRRFFRRLEDRAVKTKFIGCLLSGVVLIILLSVYLSLALQSHPIGQHLHVIFILLILLITILFCHSLIRFCMLVLLTPLADKGRRSPADEEAAVYVNQDRLAEVLPDPLGTDSSEPTVPPPAYGLWRGSVRVDPNMLHHMPLPPPFLHPSAQTPPPPPPPPFAESLSRPPSYTSDKASEEQPIPISRR